MARLYVWNPMPHKIEVRCPSCSGFAIFEFAEIVKINLKKDVPFFQESKLFEYEMFKDTDGHRWHGAIYYAGLHGGSVTAIRNLPDGYTSDDWKHSEYQYPKHDLDIGSVTCTNCSFHHKHVLCWPEEAYFSLMYKGSQLWAFPRESAIDLRNYIASSTRNIDNINWRNLLLHVPTVFQKHRAREYIVKQLNKLLSC